MFKSTKRKDMQNYLKFLALAIFLVSFGTITYAEEAAPTCAISTTDDGCKFWLINGYSILEKEKTTSNKMLLNDYRGYKTIDTYETFPTEVAISGNGLIGYASAPDTDSKMYNLYKYEKGIKTPKNKPFWQFWGEIIGLATDCNGSQVFVVLDTKKIEYRNNKGNFVLLREFAGTPTGVTLSGDGKTALITIDRSMIAKYTYDEDNDTYKNDGTIYTAKPLDIIVGAATDNNTDKIWILTRPEDGGYTKLREGSMGSDFSKIVYTFDQSNKPWYLALSGNGNVGYVALSFSWIYRFVWDSNKQTYFLDRIHY